MSLEDERHAINPPTWVECFTSSVSSGNTVFSDNASDEPISRGPWSIWSIDLGESIITPPSHDIPENEEWQIPDQLYDYDCQKYPFEGELCADLGGSLGNVYQEVRHMLGSENLLFEDHPKSDFYLVCDRDKTTSDCFLNSHGRTFEPLASSDEGASTNFTKEWDVTDDIQYSMHETGPFNVLGHDIRTGTGLLNLSTSYQLPNYHTQNWGVNGERTMSSKTKKEEKRKQFQCHQCDLMFASSVSLKRHQQEVHILRALGRGFYCPVQGCNRSEVVFLRYDNLRGHMRRVHQGIKVPDRNVASRRGLKADTGRVHTGSIPIPLPNSSQIVTRSSLSNSEALATELTLTGGPSLASQVTDDRFTANKVDKHGRLSHPSTLLARTESGMLKDQAFRSKLLRENPILSFLQTTRQHELNEANIVNIDPQQRSEAVLSELKTILLCLFDYSRRVNQAKTQAKTQTEWTTCQDISDRGRNEDDSDDDSHEPAANHSKYYRSCGNTDQASSRRPRESRRSISGKQSAHGTKRNASTGANRDNSPSKRRRREGSAPLQEKETKDGNQYLACWYFLYKPDVFCWNSASLVKYAACSHGFDGMNRLKQHLERVHRAPLRCTRCWQEFSTAQEIETHSQSEQACTRISSPNTLDVSANMMTEISEALSNSQESQEGRWKAIHRIILPGVPVPANPYFHGSTVTIRDHTVARLFQYCQREYERRYNDILTAAAGFDATTVGTIALFCFSRLFREWQYEQGLRLESTRLSPDYPEMSHPLEREPNEAFYRDLWIMDVDASNPEPPDIESHYNQAEDQTMLDGLPGLSISPGANEFASGISSLRDMPVPQMNPTNVLPTFEPSLPSNKVAIEADADPDIFLEFLQELQ